MSGHHHWIASPSRLLILGVIVRELTPPGSHGHCEAYLDPNLGRLEVEKPKSPMISHFVHVSSPDLGGSTWLNALKIIM